MSADMAIIGARLRAEREDREWSRPDMARRLRACSGDDELPDVPNLTDMIKAWEKGKHGVSVRYQKHYAAAFGIDRSVLFGDRHGSLWRPAGTRGWVTPDDEERLTLVTARPSRIDRGALDALSLILAGQRRLEDSIGPAALIRSTEAQTRDIMQVLRHATGPYRQEFGRIVAEWTTFTGWLYAATRQDAKALELFGEAEDLADDFDYGTGAALATSFRGYVARQQGRSRAVIRAASAALATPGVHQTQKTFDTLQAAQGYAALGEREEVRRLLDSAAELAEDAGEPPPPVYWYSKPFFRLNIGVVQAGIGEYRDAVDMLSSGLDGMPADQRAAEWLHEYEEALAEAKECA